MEYCEQYWAPQYLQKKGADKPSGSYRLSPARLGSGAPDAKEVLRVLALIKVTVVLPACVISYWTVTEQTEPGSF